MFGFNPFEVFVLVVALIAIILLVRWVFLTRPRNQVNEADLYIARLNAAAAHQQRLDTQKAERIRQATAQRTAAAQRNSPGRTGQSGGPASRPAAGHPGGRARGPAGGYGPSGGFGPGAER